MGCEPLYKPLTSEEIQAGWRTLHNMRKDGITAEEHGELVADVICGFFPAALWQIQDQQKQIKALEEETQRLQRCLEDKQEAYVMAADVEILTLQKQIKALEEIVRTAIQYGCGAPEDCLDYLQRWQAKDST